MISSIYANMNASAIRHISSKVELYDVGLSSTLLHTFSKTDNLQSVEIARQGTKGKFFGFGIGQQATIVIIDKNREFNIVAGQSLKIYFSADAEENYLKIGPTFMVDSVERDETKNTIKIVANDYVIRSSAGSIKDIYLTAPYTLNQILQNINRYYRITIGATTDAFNLNYEQGANFSGNETIREILDAIAEVTQTIYYINHYDELTFKTLDKSGSAVYSIYNSSFFDLQIKDSVKIGGICQVNELGDSLVEGNLPYQYVRENPFWDNRTDLDTLLSDAVNRISGLTIAQFNMKWRGNFLLEPGDKIRIYANDNILSYIDTFVLDDVISYSGGLVENTNWEYKSEDTVGNAATNPITIGEKINQTYAKVDKVNKRIDLVVEDVYANSSEIASLKLTTDNIELRVEKVENQEFDLDIENDENFIALTERVGALEISDTEIRASVSSAETSMDNKLNTAVSGLEDTISSLENTLRGEFQAGDNELEGELTTVKQNVSALQIKSNEIEASVSTLESATSTNLEKAVSGIKGDLDELEEALRAEYENADEILNESLNSEFTVIRENISSLEIANNNITASVSSLQKVTESTTDSLEKEIVALAKEVNLKVSSDAVNISINKALEEGVDKVKTSSKNYTFDDTGLNIKSSDSEFNTEITEDGMRIYKYNQEVLTANNEGVTAADLHAKTFLIIGENSRLEDRGNRTACFWIGPAGG